MRDSLDTHRKRMRIAREMALAFSKDPSTKVGAIVVSDKGKILAEGWNGFPKGIADTEERLHDREQKYKLVVHAEMNCIYNASYTGSCLDGGDLYVYGLPVCSQCSLGVIQSGIRRVFMCYPDDMGEKWRESFVETARNFDEAGVQYQRLVI